MLLEVQNLTVSFNTPEGIVRAVEDVSFSLTAGETLGIVGESGSGKSQIALSLAGLTAKNSIVTGSIKINDKEVLGLTEKEFNVLRPKKISIVFQDAMTSLNPYIKIGKQLTEVLKVHQNMSCKTAFLKSVEMLDAVKIREPKNCMQMFPHQLSGGMRQRIMIAMSLLCKPDILIADEPTTALDMTVQAEIIKILKRLKEEFKLSMVFISHDLEVAFSICDKILVLYAGQIMEYGKKSKILNLPSHPYSKALIDSIPLLNNSYDVLPTIPGSLPNALAKNTGCIFYSRCKYASHICTLKKPELSSVEKDNLHLRSCFKPAREL